jgi:LmbE family N-acetylglucosaminyl deacetylase
VLVLAPHPDDELMACGGTMMQLVAAGAHVIVVHATDGSEAASLLRAPDSIRRTVRVREAGEVADMLGLETVFWNESNADFQERPELVAKLARLIRERRPALVFTPFATDVHPDHQVVSRLLARALANAPAPERILAYQVWCLLPPNCVCEMTSEMREVAEAFRLYVTAMKVEDYIHITQDRNLTTAFECLGTPGYAEAFHSVSAANAAAVIETR